MIKNQKAPNKTVSDFVFGIYVFRFVSVRGASFDIRISDFVSLVSWREKQIGKRVKSKGRGVVT